MQTMDDDTTDRHHHGGHARATDHADHSTHEGHDPEAFRRKFWLSLALTVPVIVWSEMVQEWLGYTAPDLPGSSLIAPVLGTVVFVYGGQPFLVGAYREIRRRQPGMMLLIAMAITVAFAASLASSLGWFDLEFWWELAALITIMGQMGSFVPAASARIGKRALMPGGPAMVSGALRLEQ